MAPCQIAGSTWKKCKNGVGGGGVACRMVLAVKSGPVRVMTIQLFRWKADKNTIKLDYPIETYLNSRFILNIVNRRKHNNKTALNARRWAVADITCAVAVALYGVE